MRGRFESSDRSSGKGADNAQSLFAFFGCVNVLQRSTVPPIQLMYQLKQTTKH